MFPSCGDACVANGRRVFLASAVMQEERRERRPSEEERTWSGAGRELPNTREAPGNRPPCQGPLCLSAPAHTAIEEHIIQNTNTGPGQGEFAAGVRGGEKEAAGRKMEAMEERIYHSTVNSRPGNGGETANQ